MPIEQKICWPKRSHGASFIEFDTEYLVYFIEISFKVVVVYSYIILLHIYIAVYAKVDDTSIIMYSLISCHPY